MRAPIVPRPTKPRRVTVAPDGDCAACGKAGSGLARIRPLAVADGGDDEDLVVARRVRHPHLEAVVAVGIGVLQGPAIDGALQRDVERRAGGSPLLRPRHDAMALGELAQGIAEQAGVDDGRAVLHLAVEPDQSGLAEDRRRRAERLDRELPDLGSHASRSSVSPPVGTQPAAPAPWRGIFAWFFWSRATAVLSPIGR